VSEQHGASDPPVGQITLRYWASARAAAGVDEDVVEVEVPTTLAVLKQLAVERHASGRFRDVLGTCSVLVGDRPAATDDPTAVRVDAGQTVEFLPPFAGG
jgi:molybdopterin converting factor small subunit